MAAQIPLVIGTTVPIQQLPVGDTLTALLNVSAPNVLLGRLTTGEGGHEEIEPTDLTEDTALAGDDVVLGWNAAGALRKFKVGAFPGAGSGNVGSDTIWGAKGDLAVASANDAADRLPVGTNGQVLTADSAETLGVKWATPSGGGSPSVITVAELTSDSDNLAPSGIANVNILRVSGDNGIRGITSISATGMSDGKEFRIVNTGTQPLVLQAQHPDATSGNAFLVPKDVFLPGRQSVSAIRDATSGGFWLDVGLAQSGRMLTSTVVAGSATAGDLGDITLLANSGSIFAGSADANGHYYWNLATQSVATSNPVVAVGKGSPPSRIQDAYLYLSALVRIPTLSDGTNTFNVVAGLCGSLQPTATIANSTLIQYTHGTNSGKWYGYTSNNVGGNTTVDLGVTVAANTVYLLEVYLNKQGTEARFFVDGVYRGRTTSTMPVAGTSAWPLAGIAKSVGTTARNLYVSQVSATYLYSN